MFASQMSEIFWDIVELTNESFGHLLSLRGSFLRARAEAYGKAINEAGAPLDTCVGFIDCTKIMISRPGGHGSMQKSVYSGHKRKHCLIYQTLTTPDGLMFALFGPEVGRRHDLTLYRESGWEQVLQDVLSVDGTQYCIYGDCAYLLRPWMLCPYFRDLATPSQMAFNSSMSAVRIAVEHNYKDLKQNWTSQDFSRNLKVRKAPIALLYRASALLLNFRMCFYGGGQVGEMFELDPPTIDHYING